MKSITITASLNATGGVAIESDCTGGPSGGEVALLLAAIRATAETMANQIGEAAGVGAAVTAQMRLFERKRTARVVEGSYEVHTRK